MIAFPAIGLTCACVRDNWPLSVSRIHDADSGLFQFRPVGFRAFPNGRAGRKPSSLASPARAGSRGASRDAALCDSHIFEQRRGRGFVSYARRLEPAESIVPQPMGCGLASFE